MPQSSQLIPFVTVTNWVRAARRCGIDIEAIFRAEGLEAAQLHPSTATIERQVMQRVMERCVQETRRVGSGQHFPIALGETFAFEYLADVETFISTSATLRDAAQALAWIPPLVNPFLRFTLTEHGSQARITLHYELDDAPLDATWPFTEAAFTTVIKFARTLLGEHATLGHVSLRHAHHDATALCEAHFDVPIEHDADIDALWFDRTLLDRPLRGAFPALHEMAAQRVVEQVAQSQVRTLLSNEGESRHPLVAQIEAAFLAKPRLMGLGLPALAEELGLHSRTLQRRLKDAGDSHSAIQDRVRFRLARQWLAEAGLSIDTISERLGFSDRRSFTQAFTRWAGLTPSAWRREPPDDDAPLAKP
jgi:AraC-like DNA-binding protein